MEHILYRKLLKTVFPGQGHLLHVLMAPRRETFFHGCIGLGVDFFDEGMPLPVRNCCPCLLSQPSNDEL